MHLADFHHVPRGPRLFEHWVSHARFPSPIGEFVVELHTAIGDQPDEGMIREAERLVREFEQYTDLVVEKVFENYQRFEDELEWLEECGVPAGLSPPGLEPYLESRSLVVSRDVTGNQVSYQSDVYISPLWDSEHGICLDFTDPEQEFE